MHFHVSLWINIAVPTLKHIPGLVFTLIPPLTSPAKLPYICNYRRASRKEKKSAWDLMPPSGFDLWTYISTPVAIWMRSTKEFTGEVARCVASPPHTSWAQVSVCVAFVCMCGFLLVLWFPPIPLTRQKCNSFIKVNVCVLCIVPSNGMDSHLETYCHITPSAPWRASTFTVPHAQDEVVLEDELMKGEASQSQSCVFLLDFFTKVHEGKVPVKARHQHMHV